jgi:predicted TIM-barrel fold metal-dependent hydrolase
VTRRRFNSLLAGAGACAPGTVIDTHVHLFDPARFPYHPQATYRPPADTLEDYLALARQVRLSHAVVVHPEPYQDDHRYLEYCFAHEPSPGFFKGTCLFDPTAAETPERMEQLVRRNSGRIVALRIHENREAGEQPTVSGPIRDRDLLHPNVKATWRKAGDLGLAVQMHLIPLHAPDVMRLASEFSDTPVIVDHLARAGQGTPAQYDEVLKLARLPRVYMKFSGLEYSSKQSYPYLDLRPLIRRTYDAFGPDRIIAGYIGMTPGDFRRGLELVPIMFEFASAAEHDKILGCNAATLYRFNGARI